MLRVDSLGQTIEVGSFILCSVKSNNGIRLDQVERFTPKMIRTKLHGVVYQDEVIVLTDNIASIAIPKVKQAVHTQEQQREEWKRRGLI